jgi:hypothetical protein
VRSIVPPQDVVDHATSTWWTAEELLEGVRLDYERRGVRLYPKRFEHIEATYAFHRKRAASGGDGTVSVRQIARDLYPDVGEDLEAYRRKRSSVKRWLEVLVRIGAIQKSELRSDSGAGKALGLRVDLLPVSDQVSRRTGTRGCSSVG